MNTDYVDEKEILLDIGKRIRAKRIEKNITQSDFANKCGISVATLTRIENGDDTKLSNIIRILAELGLSENIDLLIPRSQPDFKEIFVKGEKVKQRATKKKTATGLWIWGEDGEKK